MKHIREFFTNHPDAEEVHETSNGFLFHEKHSADAHAQSLPKDKNKVETHKREDFPAEVEASKVAEDKGKKAADKKAADKKADEKKGDGATA